MSYLCILLLILIICINNSPSKVQSIIIIGPSFQDFKLNQNWDGKEKSPDILYDKVKDIDTIYATKKHPFPYLFSDAFIKMIGKLNRFEHRRQAKKYWRKLKKYKTRPMDVWMESH